ncbi:hypothetical protein [uncultured Desulfobacter sp.]|uniref:hypothetical protein n=1 Tax=uncultured Desulfobacter sp. TaxID=240139 RepID=UPI0029F488DE|nr:hypothetical protein [uncultured Desulfobacter sp.]
MKTVLPEPFLRLWKKYRPGIIQYINQLLISTDDTQDEGILIQKTEAFCQVLTDGGWY